MVQFSFLLAFSCLFLATHGLYEDQAGKFDWRRQMVGRPHRVLLGEQGGRHRRLVVATEQNVLAALSHSTGELLWRRVMERDEAGRIRLLQPDGDRLVTFVGNNLVRVWEAATGLMVSETQLQMPALDSSVRLHVLMESEQAITVIELTSNFTSVHRISTGSPEVTTERLSTPWADDASCEAGTVSLLCWDAAHVYHYTVARGQFVTHPVPAVLSANQRPHVQHLGRDVYSIASAGRLAVAHADNTFAIVQEMEGEFACMAEVGGKEQVIYAGTNDKSTDVRTVRLTAGPAAEERGAPVSVTLTDRHGRVTACHVTPGSRRDQAARVLLLGEDDAVTMTQLAGQKASLLWTREESLASVVAVEEVDLPMSAGDVSIEEEFADPAADPYSAFLRRMRSQYGQLKALLEALVTGDVIRGADVTHLTRDKFNLHKMIVVATAAGKLLGLHSETGAVLWAVPVTGLGPLSASSVLLGLQRGTAHFPHPPVAALLAQGTLVTFNPITGRDMEVHHLDYQVQQASLMQQTDNTHLKPLLILDTAGKVHVWPDSAASMVSSLHEKLFFYTADVDTSIMQGYAVTKDLRAVPTWRMDLSSQQQVIRRVLAKSAQERVHSQGRVLADRSVLYKYANPNLLLVLTDAADPVHKHSVTLYLVDAVTGQLVHSHVQRRVRCPCHAVHSENWLVYSAYNERARRTELTSVELFEGKVQSNASAFSSLDSPPQPMVETQAFIFPTQIEAMRETITEKGITTKFILFAIPSGSVVALNRALLDPRRPNTPGRAAGDEVLPVYTPELPLPTVAVVNYNQTVQGVRGLVTSPSGLESTCLVFVYGLDLFHTRVFPSNMFDQLKDDFDSTFIVLVLVVLIAVAAVSRRLSQRRALQHAWK